MKNKIWKSFVTVAAVAVLIAVGMVGYTIVHYLRTSPRFAVQSVLVEGLNRVEDSHVYKQARLPDDANIFSVDLAGVRQRVERLKWVRFATVQRVLPGTISIKVFERSPVGLARVGNEIFQFDAFAQLLSRDSGGGAEFPILDGLSEDEPGGNQKKVDLYLRIMEELHGKDELSEVHINDDLEVSVVSQSEPILVTLGAEKFRERWGHYLQLRTKIRTEYPDTVQVDFRFKNQAILRANPDAPDDEQKVLWDAEKKSL
ncbi:MAG TPA: FtsQ-type POTRA domain-containing protein [Terriglobia bacterium]|nr:FtsQ-type POTRA domain-containing protein [Terriglobia bacterium]